MAILRHQGFMKNTGSRVFVIFRELPNDPNTCLICYRDALPEQYVHKVTDVVLNQGQRSADLYKVMEHETLEQGQMLTVLHRMGYLHSVRTSDVEMHLGDSGKIQLDILNNEIRKSSQDNMTDGKVSYNPLDTKYSEEFIEQDGIIGNLKAEAEKFAALAESAYKRLYDLDPSLKPKPKSDIEEDCLVLKVPLDLSQAKAIELLKKELKKIREQKNDK